MVSEEGISRELASFLEDKIQYMGEGYVQSMEKYMSNISHVSHAIAINDIINNSDNTIDTNEIEAVKGPILARLQKAFLRMGTVLLEDSNALMDQAVKFGHDIKNIRFNPTPAEIKSSLFSIPELAKNKISDKQLIKLVDDFILGLQQKSLSKKMTANDNNFLFRAVVSSGLSIHEENELYNYDQVYRELYDLREAGEATEAQEEQLKEIYQKQRAMRSEERRVGKEC